MARAGIQSGSMAVAQFMYALPTPPFFKVPAPRTTPE